MARVTLPVTGDAEADQLLVDDPLALLIGMLLDQQVPMEWAFRGPASLSARLGGLDAARIAAMSPDELVEVFRQKPALHRFPASMAKRTHALCQVIVDDYDGDPAKIWTGVHDPSVLLDRLKALPGYGDEKAKIFLAILGKRFGRAPEGWERCATPFGDASPRSVADIDSPRPSPRCATGRRHRRRRGGARPTPDRVSPRGDSRPAPGDRAAEHNAASEHDVPGQGVGAVGDRERVGRALVGVTPVPLVEVVRSRGAVREPERVGAGVQAGDRVPAGRVGLRARSVLDADADARQGSPPSSSTRPETDPLPLGAASAGTEPSPIPTTTAVASTSASRATNELSVSLCTSSGCRPAAPSC